MEQTALPRADRRPKAGGLFLAVVLSVAVHCLFALALTALAACGTQSENGAPLAEVPVVLLADKPWALSLVSETASPASQSTSTQATAPDAEPTVVRVEAMPVQTPVAASDADKPRVVGPASAHATRGVGMPGGTDANTEKPAFFGVPVQARSVVYVIDRSISMGLNGGLEAAKRELLANLERLPATTRFQVLFYNHEVQALPTSDPDRMLGNGEETRNMARQVMRDIRACASTNHLEALRRAVGLRPQVIFILTDGAGLTFEHVRAVMRFNDKRAVIHTLEWDCPESNDGALEALAQLNGGTHRKLARTALR